VISRFKGSFCALCALPLLSGCREPPPQRDATVKTIGKSALAVSVTAPASASAPPIASSKGASPAPARARPRARKIGEYAVIDRPGSWTPQCLIHRKCNTKVAPLEPCEPGKAARAWTDFVTHALDFEDQVVDVSGRLELADGRFSTGVACPKGTCCNSYGVGAEVYAEPQPLPLDGFGCAGDESRLCCNVLVTGQEVIVHGRLVKTWSMPPPPEWKLSDVSICALAR
jgi:hypothetical protein